MFSTLSHYDDIHIIHTKPNAVLWRWFFSWALCLSEFNTCLSLICLISLNIRLSLFNQALQHFCKMSLNKMFWKSKPPRKCVSSVFLSQELFLALSSSAWSLPLPSGSASQVPPCALPSLSRYALCLLSRRGCPVSCILVFILLGVVPAFNKAGSCGFLRKNVWKVNSFWAWLRKCL